MTLPASFPLSMSQIASELGLSLPLAVNHPWVIALAGQAALPVSFSQLLGKTGQFNGALATQFRGTPFNTLSILFNDAPWFGGSLQSASAPLTGNSGIGSLGFDQTRAAPNWRGNILVVNNTTGTSVVLVPQVNTFIWETAGGATPPTTWIRESETDSFTVLPSN